MARTIISCPACNARFDVGRFAPGSRVKCGRCEQILTVPGAPTQQSRAAAAFARKGRQPAAPARKRPAAPRNRPAGPGRRPAAPPRPANDIQPPKKPAIASRAQPPVTTAVGGRSTPDRDPLLGVDINGVFRIIRKLGEGGYGAVYEAKDINLERRVAVKVMLPSRAKNREYVTKFLREARTAAQLSHPNVVAVHNVGYDPNAAVHYLAMEYVDGRTIHDILQERGPLPVDEAVDFIVQSCRGLQAAHERNIIHRDIKPGNLMLTPQGVIKIADFGLAKIYDAEAAKSTVIGTPYFMPPEQFEGKAKDGRTDIYALGVTFYYMLTMQRPHTGSGPAQILLSVMTKEPKSVLDHRDDLPDGIWPVVRRMIHRDPEQRYHVCKDIIRDLEALRGGSEVHEDEGEQIYCPDCGAPNPLEAEMCSACETSLLETCPKCGAQDMAGTKFCGDCGANIPLERAVAALLDEGKEAIQLGDLGRARERLAQASDRAPEHERLASLLRDLDVAQTRLREQLDAIRSHLGRGELVEAGRLLHEAQTAFPEAPEVFEVAAELEAAGAAPVAGEVAGDDLATARRFETEGRYREALVAWRGLLVLDPHDADAIEGERRVAERVDRAESLASGAATHLQEGNPPEALSMLEEAADLLPGDPVIEGRLNSAKRLAVELATELETLEHELESGGSATLLPRLRALSARFPGAPQVAEALHRMETENAALEQASRAASHQRVLKLVETAAAHEKANQMRAALSAYREAATADREDTHVIEGLTRVRRRIAEFEAFVNQARDGLESGDPERAEERIAAALEIIPGDPAAQTQRARVRSALETMRYEAERIRNALADEPDEDVLSWAQELANRFPGSSLATQVLREAGDAFKEAEQKASEEQSRKVLERAAKLEREGNIPAALAAFQQTISRFGDVGDAKKGAKRLETRLAEAEAKAKEAVEALDRGDPLAAVEAAEAALTLHANQPGPAATLAEAKTAKGEIERATKSFQEVIPVHLAERQLGRLEKLAAKYSGASQCTELVERANRALERATAVEADKQRRERCDAGREALANGQLAEAIEIAGGLLQAQPEDEDARAILDEAEARKAKADEMLDTGRSALEAGRTEDALNAFDEALRQDPSLTAAVDLRKQVQAAIEEAAATLRKAVQAARHSARTESPTAVFAAWTAVLAIDPEHDEATLESQRLEKRIAAGRELFEKGRGLLEAGDPEHAVTPLKEAVDALGNDAELQAALKKAQEQASEISSAVREIHTAIDHDDDLDTVAERARQLAERFGGSRAAAKLAERSVEAAQERRAASAVAAVDSLLGEGRFREVRERVVEHRAAGIDSPRLALLDQQAETALAEIAELETHAQKLRETGDLAGAAEIFSQIVARTPGDQHAHEALDSIHNTIDRLNQSRDAAGMAERRGNLEEAKHLYEDAHKMNPGSIELTEELSRLDDELRQRRTKIDACQAALDQGDGDACASSARRVLEKYPEDDDAIDLLAIGEALHTAIESLTSRAERQITLHDTDGATRTLAMLLRLAPDNEAAKGLQRGLTAKKS